MSEKEEQPEEKGAEFDMYHFFSRKDILLVVLLIVILLAYVLYNMFMMAGHPTI